MPIQGRVAMVAKARVDFTQVIDSHRIRAFGVERLKYTLRLELEHGRASQSPDYIGLWSGFFGQNASDQIPGGHDFDLGLDVWVFFGELRLRDTQKDQGRQCHRAFSVPGFLMTSFISAIMKERNFIGIAGSDVSLGALDQCVDQIKTHQTGYAILVSNTGIFISDPDKSLIGTKTLAD
jgi:hypothetical protein